MTTASNSEVQSASQATKIAADFLREWHAWMRPVSAKREQDVWTVQIDVGVIAVQIARVSIDAKTGAIVEFERPA